jgi:hypothetical protein
MRPVATVVGRYGLDKSCGGAGAARSAKYSLDLNQFLEFLAVQCAARGDTGMAVVAGTHQQSDRAPGPARNAVAVELAALRE